MSKAQNRRDRRSAAGSEGTRMPQGVLRPVENVLRGIRREVYRERRKQGVRMRKGGVAARKNNGEVVRRYLMRLEGGR